MQPDDLASTERPDDLAGASTVAKASKLAKRKYNAD